MNRYLIFDICRYEKSTSVSNRPRSTPLRVHFYYCLWIEGDFSQQVFESLKKIDGPLVSFDEPSFVKLAAELKELYELYERKGSALSQTARLLTVLAIMEECRETPKTYAALPAEFQAVLDDINRNFASMKRIEDLTRDHYLSRATLNRYFRRYIRSSPHEYLQSQKLSYAAKILLTGRSVTEACMSAGFSDCSRFIVLFKRRFGVTPSLYKKKFFR